MIEVKVRKIQWLGPKERTCKKNCLNEYVKWVDINNAEGPSYPLN